MLRIDIFSDLICPWCFIGKRRLDRVMPELDFELSLRWRAYQLRPGLPAAGIDRLQSLQQRHGAAARLDAIPSRLQEEAQAEAIELRYDRVTRVPNTRAGHRLMAASEATGEQHALADALFRAYFQDGQDVGERSVLEAAGRSVGMSAATINAALDDPQWDALVQADLDEAVEHQVTGVPSLILAGRFPLPGVQSDDVLASFLRRAHDRLSAG